MLRALKVGLLIERTNRKNLVALLAVVVVVFGMMFFIKAQEVGQQLDEKKSDFYNGRAALSKFQVKDASEDGDGSDLFKNLTKQNRSIALQIAALTMDNYPLYYEASMTTAELRKEAFDLEDYDKVADLLPTKLENTLNYMYFKQMVDSEKQTISDLSQYIPFLLYFFSIAGFGWYIFISFYTSSILLDDFEHTSLVKGYPVRFDQYILSKCVIAFGYVLAFIALIFICSLLSLRNGFGDITEPVRVFLGEPTLVSSISYIGRAVLYMIVISIFVMLLSIILNVLLKNMYLTLFVHFILFFLPIIFPSLISLFPYNPFNFMSFNEILAGVPVDLEKSTTITMNQGLILMVICIVLMLVIIQRFFSTGKINRA
ncbi:ABC transporter [Solibacillus sp. FSL W8-0372]|uniref:ABC transporter n=1 Tax=Solibacillus sp. FSL W8-0372 TaxID=2921713 RepID=UPI0030CCA450